MGPCEILNVILDLTITYVNIVVWFSFGIVFASND